jgi:hypothetical protein
LTKICTLVRKKCNWVDAEGLGISFFSRNI